MEKVKVVILCGGRGTRIAEETTTKPKPMVKIGNKPILWHMNEKYMPTMAFCDFILCLGYLGEKIKEYFLHYRLWNSDFSMSLGHSDIHFFDREFTESWNVILADTGLNAMTGARIKRIQKYVDTRYFMLTYGDGVCNLNIQELFDYHKSHGKIGTVTGVFPSSRFGELVVEGNQVTCFSEKPQMQQGFINGGFFVFDQRIFDYVTEDESCIFERAPLERLAEDGQLMMFPHKGFWQCMDTLRDKNLLEDRVFFQGTGVGYARILAK